MSSGGGRPLVLLTPEVLLGLDVHPLDEGLELGDLDAPLASAPELEGAQLAPPDESGHLGQGRVEDLRDVRQGEETGPRAHVGHYGTLCRRCGIFTIGGVWTTPFTPGGAAPRRPSWSG